MDAVRHRRRHHVALGDVDVQRRAREFRGQTRHFLGERRREQQRLPLARERREDAAQRRLKAHVQHPIRFVQREDLHARQIDRALLHVIDETAGRRHDDVDAAAEGLTLRAHRDAAVDRRDLQAGGRAVVRERSMHLDRQLARRHEHEAARPARARAPPVSHQQPIDHRQSECGGLAGAGLRPREQIAPVEHDWN